MRSLSIGIACACGRYQLSVLRYQLSPSLLNNVSVKNICKSFLINARESCRIFHRVPEIPKFGVLSFDYTLFYYKSKSEQLLSSLIAWSHIIFFT